MGSEHFGYGRAPHSPGYSVHPIFGVNDMEQYKQKDEKGREVKPLERPIPPKIYPVIDTDLARDNVEADLPAADRQELA